MAIKPYSALDHALYLTTNDDITFKGEGEPDEDFISVSFVNDTTTAIEGAKGDTQFSTRSSKLGLIIATYQWGSPTNDNLNQIHADQQEGKYLKSLQIKRISLTENIVIWSGINPKIVKVPDYGIGIAAANRGWNILCEKLIPGEKLAPA